MKNLALIILVFILNHFSALSQPCLPDGITFTTQAEIDNFQTNYPNCTDIKGDVEIHGQNITNLSGLNEVASIGGNLRVWHNTSLTSLSGLENVSTIAGHLSIGYTNIQSPPLGNPLLTNLIGLDGLTSVGGELSILNNESLSSLSGLDNITSLGGFIIYGNDALTSLTGLENLTSVEGHLVIGQGFAGGNPALTSLAGLANVTYVGESLFIQMNPALTSLAGLDNVTSIGENLNIWGNNSLANLEGLENVTSIGGDLWIQLNDVLSSCEVQSICDYLEDPNGVIDILDNAPGCDSQAEVEDACIEVTVEEKNGSGYYSIYPNPVTKIATFSSKEISSFEIYDMKGALVIRRTDNKVDMSGMKAGVYFVIGYDKFNKPLYKGKIIKK